MNIVTIYDTTRKARISSYRTGPSGKRERELKVLKFRAWILKLIQVLSGLMLSSVFPSNSLEPCFSSEYANEKPPAGTPRLGQPEPESCEQANILVQREKSTSSSRLIESGRAISADLFLDYKGEHRGLTLVMDELTGRRIEGRTDDYWHLLKFLEAKKLLGIVNAVFSDTPIHEEETAILRKCKNLEILCVPRTIGLEPASFNALSLVQLKNPVDEDLRFLSELPQLGHLRIDDFVASNTSIEMLSKLSVNYLELKLSPESTASPSSIKSLAVNRNLETLKIANFTPSLELAKCISEIKSLRNLWLEKPKDSELYFEMSRELGKIPGLNFSNFVIGLDRKTISSLEMFPHMKKVKLRSVHLQSKEIITLLQMPELSELYLEKVTLPPGAFASLCNCPNLQTIVADRSNLNLTDKIDSISRPELILHFSNCRLSQEELQNVFTMKQAKVFIFDKENLECLKKIKHVPPEHLNLSSCRLTQQGMLNLLSCDIPALKTIEICKTSIDKQFINSTYFKQLADRAKVNLIYNEQCPPLKPSCRQWND